MPKNKGKGGKNRRRGKNENDEKRELVFKEDGQEYAQVLRMLGNGRLEAQCIDGVKRLCHIRGKMRKKVWVNTGDIVLVGLRDYQDEKADVILKFMADEARSLKAYGELPENSKPKNLAFPPARFSTGCSTDPWHRGSRGIGCCLWVFLRLQPTVEHLRTASEGPLSQGFQLCFRW